MLGEFAPKRPTIHFNPGQVLCIMQRLSERDRAIVLVDSVLGLRRGELAFRWKDCDFDASVFNICRSWNWKTSKEARRRPGTRSRSCR
jgi:integrase